MQKNDNYTLPSSEQLRTELKRERNRIRYRRLLKNTINTIIVVAAIAVLVATLVLPVLQISGTSMSPTLENGQIVVLIKTTRMDYGDLCAFSYSNKILIKRVIGLPGDVIFMLDDGTVLVNGVEIEEPYLSDKAFGECDIEFPYTVPQESYFLMGDHRSTSIDSRNTIIGPVSNEQLIGKLLIRIWPLGDIRLLI